ncbi:MAG TPA: sigma-70 family RNA polymerase sigma factor, partial [Polyangiaceae bacterium]
SEGEGTPSPAAVEPKAESAPDEGRLAASLAAHFSFVWRTLRRFGIPEADVDDAAQLTFLTYAARLAHIEPASERSFLIGTCLRIAANHRRRQTRRPEMLDGEPDRREATGLNPEELVERKQGRALLDAGLEQLPLDQRTVFVLFELEGFSLPEIAEHLGIPLGTATSRLLRARARFESWAEAQRTQGGSP